MQENETKTAKYRKQQNRGPEVGKKGPLHGTVIHPCETKNMEQETSYLFPANRYMQENEPETEKIKKQGLPPVWKPLPHAAARLRGKNYRTGHSLILRCPSILYMQENETKTANSRKKQAEAPVGERASAVCTAHLAGQKGNIWQAAPYCEPANKYMQENALETEKRQEARFRGLSVCGPQFGRGQTGCKDPHQSGKRFFCDPATIYMQENETKSARMAKKAAEAYPTGQTPLLRVAGSKGGFAERQAPCRK